MNVGNNFLNKLKNVGLKTFPILKIILVIPQGFDIPSGCNNKHRMLIKVL